MSVGMLQSRRLPHSKTYPDIHVDIRKRPYTTENIDYVELSISLSTWIRVKRKGIRYLIPVEEHTKIPAMDPIHTVNTYEQFRKHFEQMCLRHKYLWRFHSEALDRGVEIDSNHLSDKEEFLTKMRIP